MTRAGAYFVVGLAIGSIAFPSTGPSPPPDDLEGRFVRADRCVRSGSLDRAQSIVEGIERDVGTTGRPALRARTLRELARVLDVRAPSETATALLERALALADSVDDPSLAASIRIEQGYAAWRRAEYGEAAHLAERALDLQARAGDGAGRARSLVLLGRIASKRGDYAEGLRRVREALASRTWEGDPQGEADVRQALGEILLDFRSFAGATAAFERRLALVREVGDRAQEAHALNYLAFVSQLAGDLDRALSLQEQALAIARASEDPGAISHALHAIGSVHRDLGRLDEARADYVEAARLREAAGDPRSRAWSLAGLGRVEKESARPRAALDAYRAAVEVFAGIRDRRALAWHLLEVARLHAILGERAPAREAFEATIREMRAIELPYSCLALAEYGILLADDGAAEGALEAGRRARAEAEATGNPEMRWSAAHGDGKILRRLGRREKALAAFLDAIAVIEAMRIDLPPSDAAKSGFFQKRQEPYEDAADLLVELGRPGPALEIAERARARAFLDLLGAPGRAAEAAREVREEGEATAAPADAGAHEVERGAPGKRAGPAAEAVAPIPSGARADPPDLTAIQDEARRRSSPIVEYFTLADRSLCWLVSRDGTVRNEVVPLGRVALRRLAELAQGVEGGEEARRELHRRLIAPFSDLLPTDPATTILVVPHGPLFLVSFAGLPDERGRYLVERHAVAYAPSIGVLRRLRTRPRPSPRNERRVLVVGNPAMPPRRAGDPALPPLPGADEEARTVRDGWPPGTVTVLRGDAARESAVRRLAPRSSVIHFATHGVERADEPMLSYVALAPDPHALPESDGYLTVREVFDLSLDADLVVLSACDTGRGRIDADGVMGLGRAFLHAGASAVVATLWRVADRVALRQMATFHTELRNGTPAAAALRRAQLRTLEDLRAGRLKRADGGPIGTSPAYWAAFVVIGG